MFTDKDFTMSAIEMAMSYATLPLDNVTIEVGAYTTELSSYIIGDDVVVDLKIYIDRELDFWRVDTIARIRRHAATYLDIK